MRCVHCDSDTKYPIRKINGNRCGACGHPFAFEPKNDSLSITDPLFQRIIKDVSGDGSLFYTDRQLWYEFNRRLQRRSFSLSPRCGAVIACSGIGGIVGAVALASFWPVLLGAAGVGVGIVMNRRDRAKGPWHPRIDFQRFQTVYLARWLAVHGPTERLLSTPIPRREQAPRDVEPDLTSYSFDRAVITDRDETAAVLIANNFHFENNCAILSVNGYPHDIAETVLTMLRRNPGLRLFALHDASWEGCRLPLLLRGERWFPDTAVQIVDLGLRPRHVSMMKLITLKGQPQRGEAALPTPLTPEEQSWLEAGNTAEVAALRPARLMRSVYQGFTRARQLDSEGAGAATAAGDGGFIWIPYGGADLHAADSFG